MALLDWDRNLFTSDPTLFERFDEAEYQRAARDLAVMADPIRLRLLHALSVGEDTPQRAALWSGLPQSTAERELSELVQAGIVQRRESVTGVSYTPMDGHHVVQLHVALAHGRERSEPHPRLLTRRRMPSSERRVG